MPLPAGTRIGPYEITAPIAAGGMGEVYRARDTRLDRHVAVKILPELFAADPERLARFEREARTLASLNHPGIAQVYGFESAPTSSALVMELVDGDDLSAVIARGPVPVAEALTIARQIAAALEAAHDRGIIHRDLKPANIMLTGSGDVKVLDFGLAKALDPGAASHPDLMNSPTITSPATAMGMILGTAAYMSPEQAAGKQVDRRSDLWAFGVVLLEMLTGRQVFRGETVSHVLAAVLKDEPDWPSLPPDTPASIRKLLRRCLEKDRKRRLDSAADARLEIEDALSAAPGDVPTPPAGRVGTLRGALPWAVTAVALSVAGLTAWRSGSAVAPASIVFASLQAPEGYVLGEQDPLTPLPTRTPIVFTPDGRSLIIQAARDGRPQLFLRSLDRPDIRPIPGTDDARAPFVSPDGKWIGFASRTELRKIPVDGGAATTICPLITPLGPNGASWGEGDVIVYSDDASTRLMQVSANGGVPAPVTAAPLANRRHVTPFMLPGGKRVLYADVSVRDATDARLMVQDLAGGEPRLIVEHATDGRVMPGGQLAFMRLGTLMMAPFDLAGPRIMGEPLSVLTGVMQSGLRGRFGATNTGAGMYAVSSQGTLAAIRGDVTGPVGNTLTWIRAGGSAAPAEPITAAPVGGRLWTRISPDGQRAAVRISTPTQYQLWIADWQRNVWTQCADCPGSTGPALWSPDSRRLLLSNGDSLIARTLDGSAADQVIVREPNRVLWPSGWLADGRVLYLSSVDTSTFEVKLLDAGAPGGRTILPMGDAGEPAVSPDGRWLAYTSMRTAQREVVVQAFPGPGAREQVSAGGGRNAAWSPDGRTLYYIDNTPLGGAGSRLFGVDVMSGTTLRPGTPREILAHPDGQGCVAGRCYDITQDGSRFLMRDRHVSKQESVTKMDLIVNWMATLNKR